MREILIIGAPANEALHRAIMEQLAEATDEDFELVMIERPEDLTKAYEIIPELKIKTCDPLLVESFMREWRDFEETVNRKIVPMDATPYIQPIYSRRYNRKTGHNEQH